MDKKGKLLIIDDEIEVLNTLKRIFRKDYELYITESPKEALLIMEEFNIEVILCDQQMHEMKGTEFFIKVKKLYPNTSRILMTGYSELSDVIISINDGHIFRYVTKPWNSFDLKNAVKEAFEKNALIQENLRLVQELKIANIILEDKVKEKTQELLLAKEKAEKENCLKTEYLVNMSHEFRTPLNILLGTIQLFELYTKGNVDLTSEKTDKHIKSMKQNSFRLLRLVNNLIDISKIDAGFYEPVFSNSNIVDTIERISLSINDYALKKDIKLKFKSDFKEKIIKCDIDIIERIILNLISNAIKFSNENCFIEIFITNNIDYIVITIKDNGVGIQKDNLDIIFERYRQVSTTLTRLTEGSGIGLALTRALVELHGGKISVKSEYGKGSEFIILIPNIKCEEKESRINNFEGIDSNNNFVSKMSVEFSDIYF